VRVDVKSCTYGQITRDQFQHFLGVRALSVRKMNTHTHPFNGRLSGTSRVSRYQKCKTKQETVASAGPYASLPLAPDT